MSSYVDIKYDMCYNINIIRRKRISLSLGIYITSKELHYYEQTLTPNCRRQCNF